jgi:hypothetical protein
MSYQHRTASSPSCPRGIRHRSAHAGAGARLQDRHHGRQMLARLPQLADRFEDAIVGTADDLCHFDGAPMIFRAHVRSRVDCLSLPVLAGALAASTSGLGAAAFPPNVTVAHAGCHARHVGPGRACGPAAAESHASPTYGSPVWPIWSPAISNRRRPARRPTFMVCDCSVCSIRSSRTASEGTGQRRRPLRRGKGARHAFSRSKTARHAFSRSKTADVRGQSGSLRALRIAPASVANTEQLSMDQEATSSHGETLFRET